MAMVIREDCINCGSCEPSCPNTAISAGETLYVVDRERCTECVGAFDEPQCVSACPIEGCITQDAENPETREALLARYQQLHPN